MPPSSNPTPDPLPYQAPISGYTGLDPDKDSKTFGMLVHLSAVSGVVIPFGNFIGPLVIWLIKKDTMPFVDDQGKESLNFQITVLIALLLLSPTICIGIGFVILPLLGIAALVFSVIAGIKANEGVAYRYPWTLRLIK